MIEDEMKKIYRNIEKLKDKFGKAIEKTSSGNSIDNRWEKC